MMRLPPISDMKHNRGTILKRVDWCFPQMAQVVKRTLNAEIPYVPWLTGYLAIIVGAIVTFLVQSSSVFTSTLVRFH